MNALQFSLFVSALIFSCGIGMALSRRNAIMVLIGIELMMNAANINFIAFWRFVHANNDINGMIFVIFSREKTPFRLTLKVVLQNIIDI